MRRIVILTSLLLSAPLLRPAPGMAQDIPALMHSGQWSAADQAATRYADPVARKIVTFMRLLSPGGGSAAEISNFLADSPDWPLQGQLARRRDEAVANDPDDTETVALCPAVRSAAALLRCGDALESTDHQQEAVAYRRRAWVAGLTDPGSETRFLQHFAGILRADDQWQRFVRLVGQDAAAKRQLARLDPPHRQLAEAILALRHDDSHATSLLAAVAPTLRNDPVLILEQARWLRRAERDSDALALWRAQGDTALADAGAAQQNAFWEERQRLARRLLGVGDTADAYALVATSQSPSNKETAADVEFLAGWIALRRTNNPAAAQAHFRRLASLSGAAITQGRAHYWLAQALAAGGDSKGAKAELTEGARWLTTYYGQLSALALGGTQQVLARRLAALRDPAWVPEDALTFTGHELARAAALLASWGDMADARTFLLRLQDLVPAPADRAMTARLAVGLGMVDQAVAIARRAGRDGVMLPELGWPTPFQPPDGTVEPALALAIMRQESNFNPYVVSPAGARGLMQLMPATAQEVARQVGIRLSPAVLTADTATNMQLGTAYLGTLLAHYSGSIPLAVAAYNAGPTNVNRWLAENGDPRGLAGTDMIDWIELISFDETRNYVQRVIENLMIYRARNGIALPHPSVRTNDQATLAPSNG